MLTEEERREIEADLQQYDDPKAACIEAMKIVQSHRGWVSDESLRDLGELLRMTQAELDGVATFYNLIYRRPVGRHVILVCNSVSCWLMGYPQIREMLSQRLGIGLGQTTPDGRFTMLTVPCLGDCDHAPAMMIDSDLHHDLTAEKLDAILERYQ